MADRQKGIGRGGRGAALKQLFSQQQVRSPGDVQPGGSQPPQQPSGPAPPGAQAAGPQPGASVPQPSAQPPAAPVAAAAEEPAQTRGRGAMLQRVYEQQQQPASLSATFEASAETGNSLMHCHTIGDHFSAGDIAGGHP